MIVVLNIWKGYIILQEEEWIISEDCCGGESIAPIVNKMEACSCIKTPDCEDINWVCKEGPKENKNVGTQDDDNFENEFNFL